MIVKCSELDSSDEKDVKPKPGTIRLVGPSGSPSTDKKGRVEIQKEGKFGAICNKKWNNVAAKIACLTMGYEDGKAIGTPGQFGACEIDVEKFCVKSSKEFVLSELSCKPDDKSLLECGSSDKHRLRRGSNRHGRM